MKNLILLLLFFVSLKVTAQQFDFGNVSKLEIEQRNHPIDPEAPAAVIYKKGKVTFQYVRNWEYVYEFETRIKIYNTDGFDYATVSVPVYKTRRGLNELFTNFRAFTHNIEDGKIVTERLRNRDVIDEDYNELWNLKKFTFPNVKEGTIIEYSYKITSPFTRFLPKFIFQDMIPVDYAEYITETPMNFSYKPNGRGSLPINKITQSTEHGSMYQKKNIVTYIVKDAPRIAEENYMGNYKNYITSVEPELEYIVLPSKRVERVTASWGDIFKRIFENKSFGEELENRTIFQSEVNTAVMGLIAPTEKANAIYEYVKEKMTWNKHLGFHSQNGLRKAFNEGKGNVGDINLMLVSMMRQAKLMAYPVLVSTRNNGIPIFPSWSAYNYVICAVQIGDELILFDATNKFNTPNILPERIINRNGMLLINENIFQEVSLLPKTHARRIVNLEVNLNPDASIDGKFRATLTQNRALKHRENQENKSESVYIDELEKRLGDIEISGYEIQNKTNPNQPIIESFDFKNDNAIEMIGGKMYFNPLFFETYKTNPFTAEKREYPIDFTFKFLNAYTVNINLPEGYKIESIPESKVFQLPEEIGEFKFLISQNNNSIQLRVIHQINEAVIPAHFYDVIKEYYINLVSIQAEKIILSKI